MKSDEDALRKIIELESDNIKQERELFKHIAIVSAAIVGVFVFNGEFAVSGGIKWGLIGFIVVIVLSVMLLFLIIRLERKRIRLLTTVLQDVKSIKNDFFLDAANILANKEFLQKIQNSWQGGNVVDLVGISSSTFLSVYGQARESDEKIKEINEKLQNKKVVVFFTISSWICVLVFILSLGCFIFEIFGK